MKISMDKKYQTRDGKGVRILCVDGIDKEFPVVGYIDGQCGLDPYTWNFNGNPFELDDTTCGLVEAPRTVTHERWYNVYENGVSGFWFTEKDADGEAVDGRIGPAKKFTVTVEVPS